VSNQKLSGHEHPRTVRHNQGAAARRLRKRDRLGGDLKQAAQEFPIIDLVVDSKIKLGTWIGRLLGDGLQNTRPSAVGFMHSLLSHANATTLPS
jgi:hypothetical protein